MKKRVSFLTLTALLLAIVGGLLFKEQVVAIDFIGTIYINLLKFMIGPIVLPVLQKQFMILQRKEDI